MLLDSALEYARKGWYVFPCREYRGDPWIDERGVHRICFEKSPYMKGGFKEATTSEFQIISWWKKWPRACIGVSCEHSNLFVVDVDTKNNKNGINNYMQLGISDAGCLHSITPSSGLHFVWSGIGRTKTNVYQGIDTRGKGGYFIAPPSEILQPETKGKYRAIDDWSRTPEIISEKVLRQLNALREYNHPKRTYDLSNYSAEENFTKAKEALESLQDFRRDNYEDWVNIGMSLYALGDAGLALWDEWSSKSKKYKKGDCEMKWETFEPSEITLGSLLYWAKQDGK